MNEDEILFWEFLYRPMEENQSNIIHRSSGHSNFQLQPDVINLFSYTISFYGRIDENLMLTLRGLWKMLVTSIIKVLVWRLILHTLKDKVREWLDTLPLGRITSWIESVQKFKTMFFLPARMAKLKHAINTFQ